MAGAVSSQITEEITLGDTRPIVFYDAECGLCDRVVQTLLNRDKSGRLRFAPLGGATAREMLSHVGLDGSDGEPGTMVCVSDLGSDEGPRMEARSDAALRTAVSLGGVYGLMGAFYAIPKVLRDGAYKLIARNRYKIFGRAETCRIPTPEERARFLP